jgi:hypothetical protein
MHSDASWGGAAFYCQREVQEELIEGKKGGTRGKS